jgi:hypothetical protein
MQRLPAALAGSVLNPQTPEGISARQERQSGIIRNTAVNHGLTRMATDKQQDTINTRITHWVNIFL